jgi:hypothetical protein
MKHVWNDAQNYGVSQEVFMVEVEVVHRLMLDGVLLLNQNVPNFIRYMRRDDVLKYQFAQTVGKRMLTERLISRGRTSIIEHHRSVAWGEREYKALYVLISSRKSIIQESVKNNYPDFQKVFAATKAVERTTLMTR